MAYATTDTDVACILNVQKTVNGESIPGYPKEYSILVGFGSHPTLSVDDWHKMEITPRNERVAAFKAYINAAESIDIDSTVTNNIYRPSSETPGVIVSA